MTPGTEHRARCLLVVAGLVEEVLPEFACEVRICARDLLDAAAALEVERSARVTLQARLEECEQLLGERAFDAIKTPEAEAEFETFEFGPGPSVPLS